MAAPQGEHHLQRYPVLIGWAGSVGDYLDVTVRFGTGLELDAAVLVDLPHQTIASFDQDGGR